MTTTTTTSFNEQWLKEEVPKVRKTTCPECGWACLSTDRWCLFCLLDDGTISDNQLDRLYRKHMAEAGFPVL